MKETQERKTWQESILGQREHRSGLLPEGIDKRLSLNAVNDFSHLKSVLITVSWVYLLLGLSSDCPNPNLSPVFHRKFNLLSLQRLVCNTSSSSLSWACCDSANFTSISSLRLKVQGRGMMHWKSLLLSNLILGSLLKRNHQGSAINRCSCCPPAFVLYRT